MDPKAHAQALARLQETDPEFHAFLAEHDKKLLDPTAYEDSEAENSDEEEERGVHRPPERLEVSCRRTCVFA